MSNLKNIRIFPLIFFICTLVYCDRYDLERINPRDPKSDNYNPDLPVVITSTPSSVNLTTAVSGGNIANDGGAQITARGVCWATTENPTTGNNKTDEGKGKDAYSSNISGLQPGTTYFVRAYATNDAGTVYGEQFTFNTKIADADGNVYSVVSTGTQLWTAENLKTTKYNNGSSIQLIENDCNWGSTNPQYCWYNNDLSKKDTYGALYNWNAVSMGNLCPAGWHVPTDGDWMNLEMSMGMSQEQADLTGWRGTDQGNQLKNLTGWNSGETGTNTQGFSALPGGFRWGDCSGSSGLGSSAYLWSSTEYDNSRAWYRSINVMNAGVNRSFETYGYKSFGFSVRCVKGELQVLPVLNTSEVILINSSSATSGGNIISDGGSPVISRGICWSLSPNPTLANNHTEEGNGAGTFTSSLAGLEANVTYYAKAYATNSIGTKYGNSKSFVLWMNSAGPAVSDNDGNSYNSIKIGTQVWMKENLRTTKLNDDISLHLAIGSDWDVSEFQNVAAYCWYNNDETGYKNTYGGIYNYFAINSGKLCPVGWHIPTKADWFTLIAYLGGETIAGGKLKESGTIHWNSPNNGATNVSGFTGLPGGYKAYGGTFGMGDNGCWWASTESIYVRLYSDGSDLQINGSGTSTGISARCIQD